MKKLILFISVVFLSTNLFAQCPANIGFELNNLTGWKSFIDSSTCIGNNAGVNLQTCHSLGVNKPVGGTKNTIAVISSAGTPANPGPIDPYSNLPMICPASGNNYVLQLGNKNTGQHAERVESQFLVSTGNTSLIYRYAAVLEDLSFGSHPPSNRPRLEFAVYDLGLPSAPYTSPLQVACPSFIQPLPSHDSLIVSPQNYPGWFVGNNTPGGIAVCSNWIPVAVNLSALLGHVIKIQFTTGDCSQGGHFGYAYIDIPNGCRPFTISTGFCPGQDTAFLHAPSGFSHYSWYNFSATPPILLGSGKDLQTPTSQFIGYPSPVAVGVVVTPPAGIGCNDTLIDSLRVLPPPTAGFTWNQNICAGSPVQFIDTSKTHVAGSYIIHWEWDFNGDGITDDTVQNPFYIFPNTGSYTIRLIVKSDLSCISDTAFGQVVNVALPAIHPFAGNDTTICQGSVVQLNGSNYPNFSYQWYTLNHVPAPANGLSNDTISNPTATPLVSTTYYYTVTDTINKCFFTDSIAINVNGVAPNVKIMAVSDTICPNSTTQLNIVNNDVTCGPTLFYCNGVPTQHVVSSSTNNITYYPTVFPGSVSDAKIQMLVLASELTAASITAGEIEGVSFDIDTKNSTVPFRLFTVKMGCTNIGAYATGASLQATSQVAYYNQYSTVVGSNYIPFQNKFMWDGVSNLVIEVCYSNPFTSGADLMMQTTTTANSVIYATSFGGSPSGCAITSGTLSKNRPTIAFRTCTPVVNGTYAWTPSSAISGSTTVKNPTVNPTTTTTYSCLVTDILGCKTTVTKTVVVDHTTSIYIGNDTTICNGQIYLANPTVSGVAPYNYTWSSNPTGINSNLATPSFSPSVTTTYYVDFYGYHNCLKKDTFKINVNPIPTSTFVVNPNPVCSADSATITYTGNAPASATFTWNFGIGASPSLVVGKGPHKVIWSTPGTKTVTLLVTNNGCTSTLTTNQVLVNQSPIANFNISSATVCTGSANTVTISYSGIASPSFIYNWNFNGGTVASGSGQGPFSVYWNNSGVANITLDINSSGCLANKSIPVTVNLTPTTTFTASDLTPCSGQNVVMTYTGNMPIGVGSFSWNFPGGSPNFASGPGPHNVSFGTGGISNASLSITNNGCTSPITILPINVTQTPSSAFTLNPSSVCADQVTSISLSGIAGPAAGYNWSVSGVTNPVQLNGSGPFNVSWTENGNSTINESITLTVTENGCTSPPHTELLPVTPNPTADFTVSSPVCVGANATVNYIGVNNTASAVYNWNFASGIINSGSGKGPYQVSWPVAGIVNTSLTVTQAGCTSSVFTVPVNVVNNPIVQAFAVDDHICPNYTASLWAEGANSYVWTFDGSNIPAINVTPTSSPTTYTVTGTDNLGCKGTGSVIIYWRALPVVNAGNDTIINRGTEAHIGNIYNIPSYKYTWASNPSFAIYKDSNSIDSTKFPFYALTAPTSTTLYILFVEDAFLCKNSDTVNVVVKGCTQLEVPNAFNPTSVNEANKYFRAANYRAMVSLTRFEIFNRWGVKLFSTNDKTSLGWDGKYQGVDQEMGSYTYYIEGKCEDGFTVHKEGNVTLVR